MLISLDVHSAYTSPIRLYV